MKHINYSVWWGYVYQWWVGVLIYLCVKKYTHVNSNKNVDILKNIICDAFSVHDKRSLKSIDMLLEWDINCFEDINLLWNKIGTDEKSTILFFQVKWKNTILSDWNMNKWNVLHKKESIHLFSKFLESNKNIYIVSNSSKLIIISNKKLNKLISWIVNPSKKEESDVREKIISEIVRKYWNRIKLRCMRKLEKFVKNIILWKVVSSKYTWTMWPFYSEWDQEEIFLFTQNTIAIINRTNLVEQVQLNSIISFAEKEIWKTKTIKVFQEIMNKSIDTDWISKADTEFHKYLKYKDVYFIPDKYIDDIDWLNKWKFIKI